jgi:hypothetical protein
MDAEDKRLFHVWRTRSGKPITADAAPGDFTGHKKKRARSARKLFRKTFIHKVKLQLGRRLSPEEMSICLDEASRRYQGA